MTSKSLHIYTYGEYIYVLVTSVDGKTQLTYPCIFFSIVTVWVVFLRYLSEQEALESVRGKITKNKSFMELSINAY